MKVSKIAAFAFLFLFAEYASCGPTEAVVEIYGYKPGGHQEIGSGFFVNDKGLIATAYHVLMGSDRFVIYDSKKKVISIAKFVCLDHLNDVALLSSDQSGNKFLNLKDVTPRAAAQIISIGHPQGSPFQTLVGNVTQDEFENSMLIFDENGKQIFKKEISLYPIDVTIYNGQSGGPILDVNGYVVALMSGSLGTGRNKSWGIPARTILKDMSPTNCQGAQSVPKPWPELDAMTGYYRGFSMETGANVLETIKWVKEKWSEKGIQNFQIDGFDAHIKSVDLNYLDGGKIVTFDIIYSSVDEEYKQSTRINLTDAQSASASGNLLIDGIGYYIELNCPTDRACISMTKSRKSAQTWKELESGQANSAKLMPYFFADADSSERVSSAITHMIKLNGGPVAKHELFETHQ